MAASIRQFAALVMIFAATAVTVAGDEGVKPSLWVEKDSIDIGSVIAGRTASATYIFHNDGPTEVKILRATPT